jgi:hypothetical protein
LEAIASFIVLLPLRIPICAFDAKTGILCGKCQAKLTAGQITEADIQVSRALVKLAEKIQDVNKMTLLRSFHVDGSYVLEVEQSDAAIVRSKPEIKQKLEEQLKGRVWVIAASNSERRFLEDLFYPISKLTKAIIPGRRVERLSGEIELLKKIVKQVKGIELMVEFEREATVRL